jgi:hypothetical protein
MLRRQYRDSRREDCMLRSQEGSSGMNPTPAPGHADEPPEEEAGRSRHEGECKPHLIDCLKCKADGIAKQAAYNAATTPDLEAAQTAYDATRKDYRTKRRDVALQVQDMRHQVKHLVERVRCSIKQGKVVECLDEAWSCIAQDLDTCAGPQGCCADCLDCEFDITGADWDCDPDQPHHDYLSDQDYQRLIDTITRYQARVDKAKQCFNDLLTEPAALVQRVQGVKTEIDAINAALAADPAATDLKMVYAQALVARRHIRLIWNGFDETRDFTECLCRALTCWSTGANAISLLTGKQAFEDCKRAASKKRCDDLQTNTVEEILALYDKLCPRPDCADDDDRTDGDGGEHHHHHHDGDDEDGDDDEDEGCRRPRNGHHREAREHEHHRDRD